jgi:mycofactocin precursor
MDEHTQDSPTAVVAADDQAEAPEPDLVEHELLVEEVSIDGMCGVY